MELVSFTQLQILLEVTISMLLGALIGIDREIAEKPAGLRTHMLVAGAATLFVGMGYHVVIEFDRGVNSPILQSDPIRIIEAVITGISFLGAGTIIRRHADDVRGLTTAASILVAAGVGVSIALELWLIGAGVTFLTLVVLRLVRRVESWLDWKPEEPEEPEESEEGDE